MKFTETLLIIFLEVIGVLSSTYRLKDEQYITNIVNVKTVRSLFDCASSCDQHTACVSFGYAQSSGQCFLGNNAFNASTPQLPGLWRVYERIPPAPTSSFAFVVMGSTTLASGTSSAVPSSTATTVKVGTITAAASTVISTLHVIPSVTSTPSAGTLITPSSATYKFGTHVVTPVTATINVSPSFSSTIYIASTVGTSDIVNSPVALTETVDPFYSTTNNWSIVSTEPSYPSATVYIAANISTTPSRDFFVIVKLTERYDNAQSHCNTYHNGLAIIYNETYQYYLNETIARSGLSQDMWLGASVGMEGKYYWQFKDGSQTLIGFDNWMLGEPIMISGRAFVGPASAGYRWGTKTSSSRLFFICAI